MKKQLRYITLEKFKKFEEECNAKYEEIIAILWEQLKFNGQIQTLMDLHQELHQDHYPENQQDRKK